MQTANQKKSWDEVAYSKNFTTPIQSELLHTYIKKEAKIIDVGCGYGRILNELHNLGYTNLTGIDFSEKMVERANKQHPHLNISLQNNPTIDFPDHSFDAVLLFAVLTCISENEKQLFLLNEIKRILKPNGIIYINDFLLNQDNRNLERYKTYQEKYDIYGIFELPEGLTLRHHSLEWVKESLSMFKQLAFQITSFPTMNGNSSNAYYFVGKNNTDFR